MIKGRRSKINLNFSTAPSSSTTSSIQCGRAHFESSGSSGRVKRCTGGTRKPRLVTPSENSGMCPTLRKLRGILMILLYSNIFTMDLVEENEEYRASLFFAGRIPVMGSFPLPRCGIDSVDCCLLSCQIG